jgi:hypothetical protein
MLDKRRKVRYEPAAGRRGSNDAQGWVSVTAKSAKSDTVRWSLALVPYNGRTFETSWRRAIFMDEGGVSSHETLYKTFYEALLRIPRLSPRIRRVVMGELGRSLREHNRGITQAVTAVMRVQLEERKWELRKEKQRPRGGIREQALTDVASRHGMTVEAFKKRLERIKPHQK